MALIYDKNVQIVVIGALGNVGSALTALLEPAYPKIYKVDVGTNLIVPKQGYWEIDFMHICIPYSDAFISDVRGYQEKFKPEVTIIHSTVPVGTSRKLNAVHSPVMGQHDELGFSLKTFPKFLGHDDADTRFNARDHLESIGITAIPLADAGQTELLKLLCSVRFYNDLCFYEFADSMFKRYGMDRSILRVWAEAYNLGNDLTGHQQFVRPQLEFPEGKIGGTCVKQNVETLKKSEGIEMNFLAELEGKDET